MKNLSIVFLVFIMISTACKKERPSIVVPPPESLTPASPTWGLNKSLQMWGYRATHYHPSNGAQIPSIYDTIINSTMTIGVFDDTTILFGSTAFDTLCLHDIDSLDAYMEFIPKTFREIGFRPYPTFLKYYYNTDSIWYFYMHAGVSYHDSLTLYTK